MSDEGKCKEVKRIKYNPNGSWLEQDQKTVTLWKANYLGPKKKFLTSPEREEGWYVCTDSTCEHEVQRGFSGSTQDWSNVYISIGGGISIDKIGFAKYRQGILSGESHKTSYTNVVVGAVTLRKGERARPVVVLIKRWASGDYQVMRRTCGVDPRAHAGVGSCGDWSPVIVKETPTQKAFEGWVTVETRMGWVIQCIARQGCGPHPHGWESRP